MEQLAEMTCNLKVNIHCDICKRKVMQVLQNLHGEYSVVINAEKGTVAVTGKVNPNIILRILDKNGKHAEFSCLELHGHVEKNIYSPYVEDDHCYYYGDHGHIPPMLVPEFSYYERYPPFLPPPPMPPRSPPPPPQPAVSDPPSVAPQVRAATPSQKPKCCSIM